MTGHGSKAIGAQDSPAEPEPSPGDTAPGPSRIRRLGIGGKLLLAFGAIAALTVAATAVAWILFANVRENLAIIAKDSLPEIATSFRIAEQSAQVSAAIPRLTAAQSLSKLAEIKHTLDDRIAAIDKLAKIHDVHEGDASSLVGKLREIVPALRAHIDDLELAVQRNLAQKQRREALLDALTSDQLLFDETVEPIIEAARDDMIDSTRNSVAAGTARIAGLIDVSFEALRGIMQIQANINLIVADLQQAAATDDSKLLRDKRFAVVGPIADIKSQFSQVSEMEDGQLFVESANEILAFAIGGRSIFALRNGILTDNRPGNTPQKKKLALAISDLNESHTKFLEISRQIIDVVDGRTLQAAANASKEGQTIVLETEAGVRILETLLFLHSDTNEMFGLLGEAGSAIYSEDIEGLRLRYELLRDRILEQLIVYETVEQRPQVRRTIEAILAYGQGERSILSSRLSQLQALEKAASILAESQNLASRLSASAQGLVDAAERAGSSAERRTKNALSTGESVLVGIAVLSLAAALLIAWLYVYRGIVSRLTNLSATMLSISKGKLDTEIVFRNANDEIHDMRKALVVFRDDAFKRRQAEEALRESERRMRLILATSPIGVGISRSEDGVIVYANERLAEQFGASARDMVGTRASALYADAAERERMLALVEKDGSVKDAEVLFRKSDGSKFWSLMSFFPIEYAGQAARLGWIYDIEARKRAEEELRDAKERAENALSELKAAQQRLIQTEKMASLGQLTAGVAHEIKNPLNFVKNFSEVSVDILEELKGELRTTLEGLDEKKRGEALGQFATIEEMLAKIKEHGNRANTIVQSMLSHSREGPASAQLTDINELLEESLDLAYHAARAEDQSFNVSLERQFDAAVGSLDVYPADLMRVFLNLISNAFYATKKRAESSHESSYKPAVMLSTQVANASVEVRIRDNGTGISQSVKDKIFNPFFTTKPPGEGTGLGLSLSYETVVKQHGGWLEVSSEEGEYTEFLVTLPRAA